MAEMKLFNRTEVIVRTIGNSYTDENENLVAGPTENITIECNIQPYREGLNSFNNPTGYRTIDAIKVYTPSVLQAADEINRIVGDQLTYKGKEYFCKDLERWDEQDCNDVSLIPVHNLGDFYRKDKG